MFELSVKAEFSSAHHLRNYVGDCSRPHGHTWLIEVFVRSRQLDSKGMAMDFRHLRELVKEITDPLDHQDLNTLKEFETSNPTAENIAHLIFEKLSGKLSSSPCRVDRVTVWENSRSSATFFGDQHG